VIAVYVAAKFPESEKVAYRFLSEVYLEGGKLAEARRAFDRTVRPRKAIGVRLMYATIAARLRAVDAPAEAVAALRAVVDEATKSGYLRLAYEARLHLARAERLANQPDAARAGLERLRKDASAKGFRLIARKATAALAAPTGTRPKPKVH
jgi:hypothetical protein